LATLDAVLEQDEKVDPRLMASERIKMKRLERLREQGQKPFYPSMWHETKADLSEFIHSRALFDTTLHITTCS
jgi:hypothetical protein